MKIDRAYLPGPEPVRKDGTSELLRGQVNRLTLRFVDAELERAFDDYSFASAKTQIRVALFFALGLYVLFALLDQTLLPDRYLQAWAMRFGIGTPFILVALTVAFFSIRAALYQWVTAVSLVGAAIGILAIMIVGRGVAAEIYYTGLILVLIFGFSVLKLKFTFSAAAAAAIIVAYEVTALTVLNLETSVLVANTTFLVSASAVGIFASYQMEALLRRDYLVNQALQRESDQAEGLLMNLLPQSIARRLIEREIPIADGYSEATIVFADIVGFTQLSSSMLPRDIVGLLNEVFMEFDQLAEKHGVEKIKTVGDSYMAVAGIPEQRPDHAEAVADMALDFLQTIERLAASRNLDIAIRIGINTGPAIAGVIGRKRFLFDVWGDAVNIASRLEAHGVSGAIHVSEQTYHRLSADFDFESRGHIEIKGKGPMPTYLLLGRRGSKDSG